MSGFDKQKFADYLDEHVSPKRFGEGRCAHFVRVALAAGGLKPITWPVPAKDWGPTLVALGFTVTPAAGYTPALGDVVVIQGTSDSEAGHIAGYDGKYWVSDFVQNDLWPGPAYRKEKPSYALYRRAD